MELADVPALAPEPFELRDLVDETAERFGPPARAKGLLFEVKTAERVPGRALGEAVWLREVLNGLVDNAVRFTDRGEVVASVTADPTTGARVLLHVEISDTGCGMSADDVARLFRRRRSRFAVEGDGGGTLQVVRRLIDLMDGQIGCSSVVGMGTTAWFTVPLDLP